MGYLVVLHHPISTEATAELVIAAQAHNKVKGLDGDAIKRVLAASRSAQIIIEVREMGRLLLIGCGAGSLTSFA